MDDLEAVDWFFDPSVHQDPYPYYEYLRAKGPAVRLPKYNVVAVTDYDEALRVFRDDESYSFVKSGTGPFPPLPFTPEGDDITAQIEAHRQSVPGAALLMSMDAPRHPALRSLLMGIITPKRLKENEEFIVRFAKNQVDSAVSRGRFEAVKDLSHPMATLVIADLLGLPEGLHSQLLDMLPPPSSQVGGARRVASFNPLEELDAALSEFIVERRRSPQVDVLTNLAQAKFPDGSMPEIKDVVSLASFLFAAGQDTTVRLIALCLRILGDDQELQKRLRGDRGKIVAFVEEVLRFESPSKNGAFRLAKVRTQVGGVEIMPGDLVVPLIAAANRDPSRFDRPAEFSIDRPNHHDHLAFGRGAHTCLGGPLARAEARIALNCLFDRTSEIRISEAAHGPLEARRYEYWPGYTARSLKELYVEVTPA